MTSIRHETIPIATEMDIVKIRQVVRTWAVEIGFGLLDQTKLVTATSELARNTLVWGGGGTVRLEELKSETRRGLRLIFIDRGSGIDNIDLARTDGYSQGEGLGLGLGGSERLMDDLEIDSAPGSGTTIRTIKWRIV